MKGLLAIIVLASFLLLSGNAYGEVYALVMKDGTVDHWSSLIEKDDRYCVAFLGGEACISKKDVLAIYKAETMDKLPPKKLVDPDSLEALRRAKESKQEIDAIIFTKEAEAKAKAGAKIKVKLVEPKKTETPTRNTAPTINTRSSSKSY